MDSYTVWLEKCPLEFQRIMNEIFNSYSKFYIVYIHDVLVFSESIKQCFKHLRTFFSITKQNGLAVSKSKISIFQTRVQFLGHYTFQKTITPIERSLEFANKFLDKILDKLHSKGFLGSLNYILDFYPNINFLAKPPHDRPKKNPPSQIDQLIKVV